MTTERALGLRRGLMMITDACATLARRFDQGLGVFAALLIVALLAVVTSGIVSRGAGWPFIWTDEVASYLMVWLSMAGWMVATRRGVHIRVRVLFNALPTQARAVAEGAFLLILALLGGIVAVQGMHLAAANSDVPAITIPLATAWLYVPLVPAGFVMSAQAFVELARLVHNRGRLDMLDRSVPL